MSYLHHAYRSDYTGQPDEQGGCLRCGAPERGVEPAPAEASSHQADAMAYAFGVDWGRTPTIVTYPRGFLTGKDICE